MINYIEKGEGLHIAIRTAGYSLVNRDGVWVSSNDVAVQAIIDSYDPLPDYKANKNAAIKAEGLRRINLLFPAITSIDQIDFYAELWTSIKSTSKAATVNFQKIIDIYSAAKSGIQSVYVATTTAGVDAVVVSWPV